MKTGDPSLLVSVRGFLNEPDSITTYKLLVGLFQRTVECSQFAVLPLTWEYSYGVLFRLSSLKTAILSPASVFIICVCLYDQLDFLVTARTMFSSSW